MRKSGGGEGGDSMDRDEEACSLHCLVCAQHGRVANGVKVPCEKTET